MLTRRQFAALASASAVPVFAAGAPAPNRLRFAAIADTHIIDPFYKGPENGALDSDTILKTTARLEKVRDFLNGVRPALDAVFISGDLFHNYPSTEWEFYVRNRTRIDIFKSIIDGFRCPVYPGFGNHDYGVPNIGRDFSHRLFAEKLHRRPFYSVEIKGCRFVHLNNFLGETWNAASEEFAKSTGSFGVAQLEWFEAELRRRQPTFVFLHYPLTLTRDVERGDFGLHPLLRKYRGSIQAVIAGHWHKWFDLGFNFGPRHYTIGSTRYDENAYFLVEADAQTATYKVLNEDCPHWSTRYARPWRGQ